MADRRFVIVLRKWRNWLQHPASTSTRVVGAPVQPYLGGLTLFFLQRLSVPSPSPHHALYLTLITSRRFGRRTLPHSFTSHSYGPSGLIRHPTRRPLAGNFDFDDLDDPDALTDSLDPCSHSRLPPSCLDRLLDRHVAPFYFTHSWISKIYGSRRILSPLTSNQALSPTRRPHEMCDRCSYLTEERVIQPGQQ